MTTVSGTKSEGPRRTRRSWLSAAVVAVVAVVVAAGATGVAVVTRHGDLTPRAVASGTVVTVARATAREEPRSAIPWGHVGPGWTAAVWSVSSAATEGTLYLLGPSGVRYAVGQVAAHTQVADVTGDGHRILTSGVGDTGGRVSVLEWDVATGTSRSVPLPVHATQEVRYTKPSGAAILVQTEEAGASHVWADRSLDALARYDLYGTLQLRYPVKAGNGPDNALARLQTPDGRELVIASDVGLVLVHNDGTRVRTLALPTGAPSCRPTRWWSTGVLLAVCSTSSAPAAGSTPHLWLIPTSGAAATALTTAPETAGVQGSTNAWKDSQGTIVERSSACGSTYSVTTPNAGWGDLSLAAAVPGVDLSRGIAAVVGNTAVVEAQGCQGGPGLSALVAYDLVSTTSTALLGARANGGTVASFVVIDPTR